MAGKASDALALRMARMWMRRAAYLREIQPDPFAFFPGDARFPQGVTMTHGRHDERSRYGRGEFALGNNVSVLAGPARRRRMTMNYFFRRALFGIMAASTSPPTATTVSTC